MATGHELAMALRVAYLALHRRTDAALAADGVTADQFVVLWALSGAVPLTLGELSEKTAADRNTLRPMLAILERRGLIERQPHPTDGRARLTSLTGEGRRVYRKLWKHSEGVRQEMFARLPEPDVDALVALLRRFVSAMDRPPAKAAPSG